jgi:hypothetical protein
LYIKVFDKLSLKNPIHHGPSSANMPRPGAAKHAVCGSMSVAPLILPGGPSR